jgi:hypothetical protein
MQAITMALAGAHNERRSTSLPWQWNETGISGSKAKLKVWKLANGSKATG